MRTTRLYIANDCKSQDLTSAPPITLDADSSKYLSRVMRYKAGDTIELFNGDGNNYKARIIDIASKAVQVQIESVGKNNSESPVSLTLVQSLAKGTKLELIIQKATELGVTRITPVITEHSVLRINPEKSDRKLSHWTKIARSACAQCNRSVVPVIDPVTDITRWFADHTQEQSVLIHPAANNTFGNLFNDPGPNLSLNILVGPEGGFSSKELETAKNADVAIVSCGPRVLRTETAGLTAIAIIQSQIGDMG